MFRIILLSILAFAVQAEDRYGIKPRQLVPPKNNPASWQGFFDNAATMRGDSDENSYRYLP